MPSISNVDFSPSSITVARPVGLGRVFYVNGLDGNDTWNGIDPGTPFKTIAHALDQCEAGNNDYIIVFNHWSEDVPIVVNKTRVHIIGVGYPGRPMVILTAGDEDEPVFQISGSAGNFCEIAGFDIGGGNNHAGIEDVLAEAADFVYIHDCNFGSEYCGDTPQDGILLANFGARSWKIERCTFLGASDTGGGTLTRDGIRLVNANLFHNEIVNCLFMACPGIAINVDSGAVIIRHNHIVLDTNQQGAGITLGTLSARCLVSDNRAACGEDSAHAGSNANPYEELAGLNSNAWTANYWNELLTPPI